MTSPLKPAPQEVLKRQGALDFILAEALDGVIIYSTHHSSETWCSPRFLETLGYASSDLQTPIEEVLCKLDGWTTALDDWLTGQAGTSSTHNLCHRHPSGTTTWFRCCGNLIRGDNGNADHIIISCTDITTEINRSQQLEEKTKELLKYSYAVSHDIKAPVGNAALALKIIHNKLKDVFDAGTNTLLGELSTSMQRLVGIVEQLHEIAALDAPLSPPEPTLLSDQIRLARSQLAAKITDSKAQIVLEQDGELTAHIGLLANVLLKLIDNSIIFCDDGRAPTISISISDAQEAWYISVADNGIGIAEENQGKIFELLKKCYADRQLTTFGLGLSYCKKAVARMGGNLTVESRLGEGSTFTFSIPKTSINGGN